MCVFVSNGPVGTPMEKKSRVRERIRTIWEDTQVRSWMMKLIVDDLWYAGGEVTFLQVRYAFKRN